jgi:hypothetical protein
VILRCLRFSFIGLVGVSTREEERFRAVQAILVCLK